MPTPETPAGPEPELKPELELGSERHVPDGSPVPQSAEETSPSAVPPERPARPGRSRRRIGVGAALAVLGLTAIGGGTVPIVADLTREPTKAEIEAAGRKETALRWRLLTAAQIFPARVAPTFDTFDGTMPSPPPWTAVRTGIARPATCEQAFDPRLVRVLVKHGCRTVLRATYVDDSGTLATTIGVAVMPGTEPAAQVVIETGGGRDEQGDLRRYGIRVARFPGTAAAAYQDSLRRDYRVESFDGPYLIFRASGWLTDRGRPDPDQVTERFSFARSVSEAVQRTLEAKAPPCDGKGVRC
jgi:hypothetical protein